MLRHTTTSGHLTKTQVGAVHEADGEHDANAYNTAMAKVLKKLKKDVPGVKRVWQNYKGTGKKKHRRQIWVDFEDGDRSIDLWLDTDRITFGGIRFTGKHKVPVKGRTAEQVYRDVVEFLKKHAMKESVMKEPVESHLHTRRTVVEGHLRRSTISEELSE